MNNIFTDEAVKKEPRLAQVDFDFSEIMNVSNDFAFLSGSVIEGFGNQASDVDIYIVSKKDVGFPDGKKNNYTNEKDGYYNEINWFSYDWHKKIADQINSLQLNNIWHDMPSSDALDYYYRTSISVPLINPNNHRIETTEYSRQRILQVLEYYYGYRAYKAMQYAIQFLEAEEIEQCYFWINKAMRLMIDSVLASNGEGYMSEKFRFLKIERAFGRNSELYTSAKKFRYLGKYEMLDYISDVMAYIKYIGITNFEFDDTVIKYKIAGSLENVDLYHHYIVHNAGNVFQIDDDCMELLKLINEGYDDRTSIHKFCKDNNIAIDKDLNKMLSQLQTYGILEIK